mmetsp:Transcript_6396/g.9900  ORF Transcript_6396/g.9900 Transcript_6396/m.9900 type:complete len:224 (+) Transcript_6396:1142-1813(+)
MVEVSCSFMMHHRTMVNGSTTNPMAKVHGKQTQIDLEHTTKSYNTLVVGSMVFVLDKVQSTLPMDHVCLVHFVMDYSLVAHHHLTRVQQLVKVMLVDRVHGVHLMVSKSVRPNGLTMYPLAKYLVMYQNLPMQDQVEHLYIDQKWVLNRLVVQSKCLAASKNLEKYFFNLSHLKFHMKRQSINFVLIGINQNIIVNHHHCYLCPKDLFMLILHHLFMVNSWIC